MIWRASCPEARRMLPQLVISCTQTFDLDACTIKPHTMKSLAPFISLATLAAVSIPLIAQESNPASDTKAIFEHTKAATVLILAGAGAGRLNTIATGTIVSKDGILLTALHIVKGAAEVQVRMANGDVFDHVELLGSDERRDVAALKIPAGSLPA